MSIQPDTVKLFDLWLGDAVDRHLLDVLHGPDALVIALAEAQDGQRIHQGIATYTGDLHVTQSHFMIQGCSPVQDVLLGSIDLAALCTGDVIDQVDIRGSVDVSQSAGTVLSRNIFHGDVTIAGDTRITGCQFRDGAGVHTALNGTIEFASGLHGVTALLGLGCEHDTIAGWHNGADHVDLGGDLSIVGVHYGRRDTLFDLSNGGTIDIGANHAIL